MRSHSGRKTANKIYTICSTCYIRSIHESSFTLLRTESVMCVHVVMDSCSAQHESSSSFPVTSKPTWVRVLDPKQDFFGAAHAVLRHFPFWDLAIWDFSAYETLAWSSHIDHNFSSIWRFSWLKQIIRNNAMTTELNFWENDIAWSLLKEKLI